MLKNNFKDNIIYLIIFILIFAADRLSKLYILNLAGMNNALDLYITPFLNFYLIWNKGIAFGLLSFDENVIYTSVTFLIIFITFVILVLALRSNDYKGYFFITIFSGSTGNLYDRVYYSAVPDFIDLHINNYHWFIFNVADIFITIGVICLILDELFSYKKTNEIK